MALNVRYAKLKSGILKKIKSLYPVFPQVAIWLLPWEYSGIKIVESSLIPPTPILFKTILVPINWRFYCSLSADASVTPVATCHDPLRPVFQPSVPSPSGRPRLRL